jgi:hypothetical protein
MEFILGRCRTVCFEGITTLIMPVSAALII